MRVDLLTVVALQIMPTGSGWMSGSDITLAFAGQTITGVYVTGLTFRESYRGDGRLDYIEPARRLSGRWSVVADTFCTLYDTVPTGGCYRVQRIGDNCFEFYWAAADEGGAEDGSPTRPRWTARGWRVDRLATCPAEPIV